MGSWSKFKSTWVDGNLVFAATNGATSGDFIMNDNIKLTLGTNSDAKLFWNGSELQGPNPASGMWANCPALAYGDISSHYQWTEDFMQLPINSDASPTNWVVTADNSGTAALKTGEYGGVLLMSTTATDNDQVSMQIGSDASGTTVEITDGNGYEVWFEARVHPSMSTECAVFIGLAEEGVGTDFISDNGASLNNKDSIGFVKFTDANDEWDFRYKTEGYIAYIDANIVTDADDYHTFGFHFDGASVLTPYVDGTAQTTIDTSAASFPSGEEMSPIISIKNGTGATTSLDVDWIRLVGQR